MKNRKKHEVIYLEIIFKSEKHCCLKNKTEIRYSDNNKKNWLSSGESSTNIRIVRKDVIFTPLIINYFYIPYALYKQLLISKLFCTNTLQTAWVGGGGMEVALRSIHFVHFVPLTPPPFDRGKSITRALGKGMGSENFDLLGPEIATHVHKNTNVPDFL
jgi:hypothetical protein